MAKKDTKKKEGLVSKGMRYGNYVDAATIAAGAVIGSAGLVAGGALGIAGTAAVKSMFRKKKKK